MNQKEFNKLVKKNLYQVFLFSCPAPLPYSLGLHHWFVINQKGKLSRWEVLVYPRRFKKKFIYIYKNETKPTEGYNIFVHTRYPVWKSKFIGQFSGEKGSLAGKMVKFIKNSLKTYPYCETYHPLKGPNSNTYIQWVINHFPEAGFKLSWRAIGKNYKLK